MTATNFTACDITTFILEVTDLCLEIFASFAETQNDLARVLGRLVGSQLGANLFHNLVLETKLLATLGRQVTLYFIQLVGTLSFLDIDALQRVLSLAKDTPKCRILLFQRFVFGL